MRELPAYDPTLYRGSAPYYLCGRPAYSRDLRETVARECRLDGTGRLLDVGCGPGVLAVALAPVVGDVVGLDPDPDMLAEADRHARDAGVANVAWVQALAEQIPDLGFGLGSFRIVTFGQSFHWMEQVPVAEVVYDLLEPGGHVVLTAHTVEGRPVPPGPGEPRIPHTEILALVDEYLGPRRRSGQGYRPPPKERWEVALSRTRFGPARHVFAPGRPDLVQDVDGVVANYLSMSFAAPHLFGERLDRFVADLRQLLGSLSASGLFWDWPGDTEIMIASKPAAGGADQPR